jgi:hypothetical protein
VLVINYDSVIEGEGGRRLREVCGWNDPATLSQGYIDDIRECSGGFVRYQVVETITVDEFPLKKDGFRWGNKTPVRSTCDDWLTYPRLTGRSRTVTCADWGNGDIRAHHKWWLDHLPRSPGRTEGKRNNWWAYVCDFNRYPESR